nr:P-selectin glycoprotein ligand 1 isoform X2 [Zootoca vivipara]
MQKVLKKSPASRGLVFLGSPGRANVGPIAPPPAVCTLSLLPLPKKRKLHHVCSPKPPQLFRVHLSFSSCLTEGFLFCPAAGKMAPFWLSLWMVLWSLLTAGSFRLPTLRLLIQDGAAGSQSASPEKWMWKRAGDDGQESPRLPCGKTDGSCKHPAAATAEQAKKSLTVTEAESSTSVGKTYNGATAEVPTNATTTLDTFGKVSTEVGTTKEVIHLSTTKSSRAPVARVRRLAPTVGATTSQSMPNETEKVATALQETMMVLAVPKKLLVGATSSQSMVASSDVSTAKLRQAVGTTGPSFIAKGKVKFPHSTAKPSPATDWLLLDDMTSSMVASSDVSTAKLRQAVGTTGPSFIAKGKVNFPHSTAKPSSTTDWLLLDDVTSSHSMVANSDVSTAKLRQAVGTTGPSFIAKVAISATITTAKVKPPSVTSLGGATILVGKCLLWIFILALIAGIFIVATGVLATMLWRQKRAYKMNGRNHTEMVCISSLLAAEEAEEAGGRHPRGKRVKMLGANGSEADMDNLTLNSFLPEH